MKPFTTIAIAIFTLVAIAHLIRIILDWEMTLNGAIIPMWASALGLVITAGLAVMLWREARK